MLWQMKSDRRADDLDSEMRDDGVTGFAAGAHEMQTIASIPPSQEVRLRTLRVLPRLTSDLISVATGLGIFSRIHRGFSPSQVYFAAAYLTIAAVIDATHVRRAWNYVEEFVVSLKTVFWATVLVSAGAFFVDRSLSRILFGSVALVMLLLRPLAAALADRASSSRRVQNQVAVVSAPEEFEEVLAALQEVGTSRLSLTRAECVDLTKDRGGAVVTGDLVSWCNMVRPTKLVVGDRVRGDQRLLIELARINEYGTRISSIGRFFEEELSRVRLGSLDGSWFVFDIGPLHRLGYRFARRIVDLVFGVAAGVVLLVLLPFITVAVKLDSRGPLFFSQRRVGQHGKVFTLHKIRSMSTTAEQDGPQFARHKDERVTAVGRVIRRCRVDELPQALNLIRGDLSLIGPRPERPQWVEIYRELIPFYDKRTIVKPGITGWAQVHEGYSSSLDEATRKLERDLYYMRYQSLGLDLRIGLMTLSSILRFQGR